MPNFRTPNYFKLVNDGKPQPHCLRERVWLEAAHDGIAYAVAQFQTTPDGFGQRQVGDTSYLDNDMLVRVHFMRFDRRMREEGYVRETAPRESEAGRAIGCTPRPTRVIRNRRERERGIVSGPR